MLSKKTADVSLRKAFLKRFFWGTLLAWFAISFTIYNTTSHELDELYDGEMAQIAHVLLGIYGSQQFNAGVDPLVTSSPFEGGDNYEHKLAFQIWDNNSTLLLRSQNAPLEPMASQTGQFQTRTIYDNEVRTLSIQDPGGKLTVHVAQNIDIRHENVTAILESLLFVLILAFPLLMWLINKGINQGTKSLNTLSENIARRTEHDLSPIETDAVPTEIKSIIDALNKLMYRVKGALGRERQFISDAAHELRTPLSGIKAHAQLALKDENRRQNSLTRIVEGVDRTTRLANQLLTLSGVDAMTRLEKTAPIDVEALIRTVVEDLDTRITEKSIQFSARFECKAPLPGNEDLLYILLRNLIDNAIRYAPDASHIDVAYQQNNAAVSITVTDEGPGIPAELRERVFDRFYRDIETGSEGSGLGLAIAVKIATLHGAQIQLAPAVTGTGLSAKVIFA